MSAAIPIKLVIVGDGAIGKTCILVSYAQNRFPTDYVPTIFDNSTTTIKVDGRVVNLGLWDTAGQEEYARLRPLAYPNTDIFLLAFAVNERSSLTNAVKRWYPEVRNAVPEALIAIVGNKIDLRSDSKDHVTEAEARQKIKGLDALYFECSALTRDGLVRVFQESVRQALRRREKSGIRDGDNANENSGCPNCQLI